MAGIRTAAVINVGTATLAAFIGAGGLGEPIVAGLTLSDTRLILSGALPAAVLAIAVDGVLARVEQAVAPRGLRAPERPLPFATEDLAAVLHEKGIGTPATRADIIENLVAKGYVVRVDRALRPTVKGIRLIDTLGRIHIDRLTSPELTGEIEYHLLQVERGGRSAEDLMEEITGYASEVVERAK